MKIDTLQKYVDEQLDNWAAWAWEKKQSVVSQNDAICKPKMILVYNEDDAIYMESQMLDLRVCYIHSFEALCHRHLSGRTNDMIRDNMRIRNEKPSKNAVIKLLECGEHFLGRCLMEKYHKKH